MAQKCIMYLLPCGNFGNTVAGGQNLPVQLHCLIFAFGHLHLLHVGWRNLFSSCAVVCQFFGSGGK
jgi:hypothetical protein